MTLLAVLELEAGVDNPLHSLPEATEFYDRLPGWYAEQPEVGAGTCDRVLRLFSDAVRA